MNEQTELIEFLSKPGSYDPTPKTVECIETHGAMVFLAGDDVFKIKRCVKYSYLDFSTLEKRHAACAREIEINQPQAPEIYLELVAITREVDGGLAFGGTGDVVEWAVHMRRFAQEDMLYQIAKRGELTRMLTRDLADVIAAYHDSAPIIDARKGADIFQKILGGITDSLAAAPDVIASDALSHFKTQAQEMIAAGAACLAARAQAGFVRRCHGDLHLQNIVLIDDRPVLFDAIEFDEKLARIDTLYDLAFLLMDLDHKGLRAGANFLQNRYLFTQDEPLNYQGLKLMALFLALRAAIRAMVSLHRGQVSSQAKGEAENFARDYFAQACSYLNPPQARLIAIGGFSGTGKSTLAAALAPRFGAAPGAVHLRSDLERKGLFHVEETHRLGEEGYTSEATKQVYDLLNTKAEWALGAGHSVIVDAVFSTQAERAAVERIAHKLSLPFTGLWLSAPRDALIERVGARRGDASDATSKIVEQQLARGAGSINWHTVDAGGTPEDTVEHACTILEF